VQSPLDLDAEEVRAPAGLHYQGADEDEAGAGRAYDAPQPVRRIGVAGPTGGALVATGTATVIRAPAATMVGRVGKGRQGPAIGKRRTGRGHLDRPTLSPGLPALQGKAAGGAWPPLRRQHVGSRPTGVSGRATSAIEPAGGETASRSL
jgi:hypothetical protein